MSSAFEPEPVAAAGMSTSQRRGSEGRWVWIGMATVVLGFVTIAFVAMWRVGEISGDVVVALIAALASAVVSIVVAGLSHLDRVRADAERRDLRDREERERKDVRYEEVVLKSLDYFTGHTQRRNVGIAIVEGAWQRTPHLRPVFVPLLVNQAVYLLEESGQAEARHEVENLRRIMSLLTESRASGDFAPNTYAPVIGSITRRLDPNWKGAGVEVSNDRLTGWRDVLSGSGS